MDNPKELSWSELSDLAVAYLEENGFCSPDHAGFCKSCGEQNSGMEPDARPDNSRYTCESCGSEKVYGVEACI